MATDLTSPAPADHLARLARRASTGGPLTTTGVVVVIGLVVVFGFGQQYVGSVLILAFTYAIVTTGMAVQIGFSQQIAFSQSVFMGLGAYGAALLNTHLNLPTLLAAPIVMIASGLVALLLGSVVTRASGLALAVATIMLPLIATGYVSSAGYLGGSVGMPLSGNLWQANSPEAIVVGNGVVTVVALGVVVFIASRILHSDIGLELYALGVDERTAAAMGIATPRRKLELFVLGSMFAALGGAVYAGSQLFVPATLVTAAAELSLLIMLFVGGRRSIIGAVVGALVVQYVSGASEWVSVNILLVEGALITVVLLVDPEGLAGIAITLRGRLQQRRQAGPPQVPSPGPPAEQPAGHGAARLQVTGWAAPAAAAEARPGVPLLECSGVSKDYGGLHVLDVVSLTLPARGRYGLCGPNGAGKSTLLGVIGGTVTPSAGRVLLAGTDVTGLLPQQRFHLGMSRTFQAVHLIAGRTVLDNVAVSCLRSHGSSIVRGIARSRLDEARDKAAAALDYLGLRALSGRDVSSLTLESQRMVEFARAIAPQPRLLLLDEPAAGLSEPQRDRISGVLHALGEATCVLLVEHDLGLVAQITERIFVLDYGRLVFEGNPAEFQDSEIVNSLLIGQ
jgi:branched-chain amino acid transport system permease protein